MKPAVKKLWKTLLPHSFWKMIFSASSQLVHNDELAKKGFNSMLWSIENLKKLGFKPETVLDVGAYKGEWTKDVSEIFTSSAFLMVEAQPDKAEILNNWANGADKIEFVQSLAGPTDDEEKTFHVMKTGSSVFEQKYEGKAERSTVTLKSSTLDTIIDKQKLKGEYFLKLDVQGYEIEVLKGAKKILKETPVILLEASLLNYNEGAPLVKDVINFLDEQGFILFDICEFHRKSEDGVLNQVDLIFCKKDWEIRKKVNF